MADKLTPTGKRTPLTPDVIKLISKVGYGQVNAALLDMMERNPVLASLMLAEPVSPPKKKGK